MKHRVLLIGGGGREHALAFAISKSASLEALYCMPGNPGTAAIATNLKGSVKDFDAIKNAVIENDIDLVVCGPEEPLVLGLRDAIEGDERLKGVLFVGPGKEGARLEGSKDYAKDFMMRHGVPTAAYKSFSAEQLDQACDFMKTLTPPYVLKADGLAAGKGVLIVDTLEQARKNLEEMFSGKFGAAGNTVVIEQFLTGIECSVFVLTDGKDYMILPEAKDYKRALDADQGLNTGGMGAVSPVPFADKAFMDKVCSRIVEPTLAGLKADGIDYKGFIFLGLMRSHEGDPYVIEYNVRMGDPETEAVMTRIESDFLAHLVAAAAGSIASQTLKTSPLTALTCIIVSGGYPEDYKKGYPISGLDASLNSAGQVVFHSGTSLDSEGRTVSAGGRVLAVTTLGNSIPECREALYERVGKISFTGSRYRSDIGLDVL